MYGHLLVMDLLLLSRYFFTCCVFRAQEAEIQSETLIERDGRSTILSCKMFSSKIVSLFLKCYVYDVRKPPVEKCEVKKSEELSPEVVSTLQIQSRVK